MPSALRIAVLVKQIPEFEAMELGADGRLVRDGLALEMNPYCRRAVAQAVALATERAGTEVVVFTLGPPSAQDALREALAWGAERGVPIRGVLVSDPRFAGSDSLATSRALVAAIDHEGSFDLVLLGRNSVDADTGQVGPQIAELLDLPFLAGVRHLSLEDQVLNARCEHDDGWMQAECVLPVVISCAERLIDPTKVDAEGRAAVDSALISHLGADELGTGPWGTAGSPTSVGRVRILADARDQARWPELAVGEQVRRAVAALGVRGAFAETAAPLPDAIAEPRAGRPIGVLVEPNRAGVACELLGDAARLGGPVTALLVGHESADRLGAWGADAIVRIDGPNVEEVVAAATWDWVAACEPWALLAGSTAWGREVASRVAAHLGAGLTGDAVELDIDDDGRLVAWKPSFGGQLVAAITSRSPTQMVTIRAGVLPRRPMRATRVTPETTMAAKRSSRLRVLARTRDDDLEVLADALVIIGLGRGVDPADYPLLEPLRTLLGAELGATRKVTDQGWLPRSRQIGITGRSVAPRLFVSIGAQGKFNHTVGVRGAGSVLAINADPHALVFDAADAGIVGDWREVVPILLAALLTFAR